MNGYLDWGLPEPCVQKTDRGASPSRYPPKSAPSQQLWVRTLPLTVLSNQRIVLMFKKTTASCVLAIGLFLPSCLGPNNAYNGMTNWTAEATETDWINECIFVGLNIIPVLPVVLLGDLWIFNTLGYWGTNPIGEASEFPKSFGSDR